jgi:hypothetical protein
VVSISRRAGPLVSTRLPAVIDAAAVEALAGRLIEVGNTVIAAMDDARDRWWHLGEVFDVRGAEGVPHMLDHAVVDARAWAAALSTAYSALVQTATWELPALKMRRDELAERIADVNARHASAEDDDADDVASAGADLEQDIRRFRRDVEETEEQLAQALGRVTGGTEIRGSDGTDVAVSNTYWGAAVGAYQDGMSGSGPMVVGLADRLERGLGDAAAERIEWLATADRTDIRSWLAAHADFGSTVGFVDPGTAARLYEGLAADSIGGTPGADGLATWESGPLAHLLAFAPAAIANLNGVRAAARQPFAIATLRQLLADPSLSDEQFERLFALSALVDPASAAPGAQQAVLLGVFLDSDGSPRASIAYGDVDTADQITTLTHGISTDLGALRDWKESASALQNDLITELAQNGSPARTAMVVYLEWDSGDATNVWNIERPDAGAERLAQLLGGFQSVAPDAELNVGAHSLGTTMTSELVSANPGLVDHVWFFGSAGVNESAAGAIREQISAGTLNVHATHASDDWVAPIGRWPVSEHPVDPRTIPGVVEFSSDGGFVADYGPGDGEYGERVEGHNSQRSTEWYYLFDGWTMDPTGNPVPIMDDESIGYLDPRSQSFKEFVMDLTAAAEATR